MKMARENFFLSRLRFLKESFTKLDRRFIYITLLEIALIIITLVVLYAWNNRVMSIGNDIDQLKSQLSPFGGNVTNLYSAQLRDDTAVTIFTRVILSSAVAILFIIFVWTILKNKIYNMLTATKFSWRTYWRFVVVTIIWGAISVALFMIAQFLVYLWLSGSFETSFWTRALVLALLSIVGFTLYWLTINLFSQLAKHGKIWMAIKSAFHTGITGFVRFLFPLTAALVSMILLNIIFLAILALSEQLIMIFGTLLAILYFTWMRFYYYKIIESSEEHKKQKTHKR